MNRLLQKYPLAETKNKSILFDGEVVSFARKRSERVTHSAIAGSILTLISDLVQQEETELTHTNAVHIDSIDKSVQIPQKVLTGSPVDLHCTF